MRRAGGKRPHTALRFLSFAALDGPADFAAEVDQCLGHGVTLRPRYPPFLDLEPHGLDRGVRCAHRPLARLSGAFVAICSLVARLTEHDALPTWSRNHNARVGPWFRPHSA